MGVKVAKASNKENLPKGTYQIRKKTREIIGEQPVLRCEVLRPHHREVHHRGLLRGDDSDPMTLNRYIYGRDNPGRYSDPSGHMLLVAEGGGGSPPPCNGSPDVCLTRGGNYQYSYPTATTRSPDITLTEQGNYQYSYPAPAPKTQATTTLVGGVFSSNYASRKENCFEHECGAWGVTIVLGVATGFAIFTTLPGLATPFAPLVLALDTVLIGGEKGSILYDVAGGSGANPVGAFGAYLKGEGTGFLGWLLSNI